VVKENVSGKGEYNQVSGVINGKKEKVKVTLVHALRLCTGRTAHMGSRGIAIPFL
jgi:hypothetical protein